MNASLKYFLLLIATQVSLFAESIDQRVAGLQQDVVALQQTVGILNLEIESLREQMHSLREHLARQEQYSHVASAEAWRAEIHALRTEYEARVDRDKKEILSRISKEMDKLARLIHVQEIRNDKEEKVSFSEDYPKEGIAYTVKPGDTLSKIAQDNASTIKDIQNANKIVDPKSLRVGQQLFVPQKK